MNLSKKHLLILTTNPHFPTNIMLENLVHEHGLALDFLNPFNQCVNLQVQVIKSQFSHIDFVYNRNNGENFNDTDLTICHAFKTAGFALINNIDESVSIRDKHFQVLWLKSLGLQTIPSFTIGENLLEVINNNYKLFQNGIVLKTLRGSQSKGVCYYNSPFALTQTLKLLTKGLNDQRFFIQPYIPHEFELRVYRIGEELMALKKLPQKDHEQVLNFDNSVYELISPSTLKSILSQGQLQQIRNIKSQLFAMDFLGGQEQIPTVLEINLSPGFKALGPYWPEFSASLVRFLGKFQNS